MNKNKNQKVIVSLTTFPARINNVHKTIESILCQKKHLDKIVLYLVNPEFTDKNLPGTLTDLTKTGIFEIRWTDKDIRSYNKLINALIDFPNDIIITIDDDVIYPDFLIKNLLKTHRKNPLDICANRIKPIPILNNQVRPYRYWRVSEKRLFKIFLRSYKTFFCGIGGVLYPPHSLSPHVFNEQQFTNLCRHQDDVWFWAMAVLNNTKIQTTRFGYSVCDRTVEEIQKFGLWQTINSKENVGESPNDIAMKNVLLAYPEIAKKIGIK